MKNQLITIVTLSKLHDDCDLIVAENSKIPFPIKRVYSILNAESNMPRGYHAHRKTQQILFCLKGSVRMILDNGVEKAECVLSDPSHGLLLDTMVWHEMHDMDESTILLVLASHEYDEADYIRDYEVYTTEVKMGL